MRMLRNLHWLSLLTALGLAALIVNCPMPAQAQTYSINFANPSTFEAYGVCGNTCTHSQALAIADFNGDGKLDEANIDSQNNLDLLLGNGNGTFQLPQTQPSGMSAYAIAAGDFNGDGLPDVAVWGESTQNGNAEVEIFLSTGDNGFAYANSYSTQVAVGDLTINSLAVADINGDGKLDVVALSSFDGIYVFLGNGDGSLQTPVNYGVGTVSGAEAEAVAVADVNGDGKPDAVVSYYDGISVLLNNGAGTFTAPVYYSSNIGYGQAYGGLAIGDVNGDKQPDIVETNSQGQIAIFLNQGSGTFAISGTLTVSGIVFAPNNNLVLADVNNDKKLDIVVPDYNGDVHTFYGKGNGSFSTGPGYSLGTYYGYNPLVALGDFNDDGTLDLLSAAGYELGPLGQQSFTNSVSLGRGDGTFQTAQFYGYGLATGGQNIVTADFNGDGIPDVAYSYVGTNVGTQNEDFAVLLGSSHGAFGNPILAKAGSCTSNVTEWIATGDVNGDGFPDVVATLVDSTSSGCQNHTLAVITGKGTGAFNAPRYYATSASAQEHRVYLGDVNGDGKLDIITENEDGTISVLLNRGNGTYKPGILVSSIAALYGADLDLVVADVNNDGKADIAATSHAYNDYSEQNYVWVLLSTGNGTFSAPLTITTTDSVMVPVAADFNNDGKVDLVAAALCRYGTGFEYLPGNGDGTFSEATVACPDSYSNGVSQIVAGDFNGDGNKDFFMTFSGNFGGPLLFQGAGNGSFTEAGVAYPGTVEAGAAVADFNGDGMQDVAVLNNFNVGFGNDDYANYVSVMQNATQPVGVSPRNVNYGTVSVGSSKSETVILTNDQTTTLKIKSISISGADAGDFSETSNCGTSRKAGWDCTMTVKFTPQATGARSATLNIVDSVGTQTAQLNGTGQ